MSEEKETTRMKRDIDRSPVIALLLAQYRGIQTERIVLATSMRILWFILLLVFALTPNVTPSVALAFGIIAFTLFFVSFYASRRTQRLEASIRDSLVRLDPDLEDYYINALHDAREKPYHTPFDMVIVMFRRAEDVVWLMAAVYILIFRFMPFP